MPNIVKEVSLSISRSPPHPPSSYSSRKLIGGSPAGRLYILLLGGVYACLLILGLRNSSFEGVCSNSRHPDHRRVWKGGSEQHSIPSLPGLRRLPGMSSETSIFDNPSITLAHFCCPRPPKSRLQPALEAERDPGTSRGSFGTAL